MKIEDVARELAGKDIFWADGTIEEKASEASLLVNLQRGCVPFVVDQFQEGNAVCIRVTSYYATPKLLRPEALQDLVWRISG